MSQINIRQGGGYEMLASFQKSYSNIVNSLIGDKFKQFVVDKIVENNRKIDEIKGNKFELLPKIASVFADTKFVSSI